MRQLIALFSPINTLPNSRRQQFVRSLLIGLVIAAFLLLLWWGEFFARVRLRLNDVYYVPTEATSSIVMIAIDDTSFREYGRSLTDWSRTVFGDLVTVLADANARVVTFDVLMVESTSEDEILADAIQAARLSDARTRVVIPVVGNQLADIGGSDQQIHYIDVLSPPNTIMQAVENTGYINVFPDADNTIRRQLSVINSNERPFGLSLGLTTYLAYLRVPVSVIDQVVTQEEGFLNVSGRQVPVDENGLWLPNYFTRAGYETTYPVVSLTDVLGGNVDLSIFNDKVVFVGVMNSAGMTDLYTVPAISDNRLTPGVELHANVVETLIQNIPLMEQSRLSQGVMILALTLISSMIYAQLRWHLMLPMALVLVVVWIFIAFINFSFNRLVIEVFYSLLALTIPVIAMLLAEVATEIRLRRANEFLLRSVVEVSSQQMEIKPILERVARDIRGLTATDAGAIWLKNVETGKLQPAHTWSEEKPSANVIDATENPDPFAEICAEAVQTGKSVIKENKIALPVMWQGRMLGMFTVQQARIFNSKTAALASLRVLDTLAQQIAPSFENAFLFSEIQRQKSLLEAVLAESPAGMLVLDSEHKLLKANAMADAALDIDTTELIGTSLDDILSKAEVQEEARKRLIQQLSESKAFRDQLKHDQRTYAIDVAPIAEIGEYIVIFNNITALTELSELKTHMIRMASHDLNNPLASVIGNSQILLEEVDNPIPEADRRIMIEYIHNSGKKMQRIIEDILSLERVRSSTVFKDSFDFRKLVEMVIAENKPDVDRKKQTMVVQLDEDLPWCFGDQTQILQAITNLIGNAIKYTPENGNIEVRLLGLDKKLRFEVEDNGYGIPLSQQQYIFQEFFRVKNEATMRIQGTGLGLSLVRSVIEAHDGRVWFMSQEGEGSTFFIDLPYATP